MGFSSTLAGGPSYTAGLPGAQPGRSYSGNAVIVDRALNDFTELTAAGWTVLANHRGTTAQRPIVDEFNNAIQPGFRYLDTTLSKVIVRGATAWLDPVSGAPV